MSVQGDAMAKVGSSAFERFDGLLDQRTEGGLAVVRGLFEAHDMAVVAPQGLPHFFLEHLHRQVHGGEPTKGEGQGKRAFPGGGAGSGKVATPSRRCEEGHTERAGS